MRGRGKIDGNGVPGKRPAGNRVRRQKFRNRKPAQPQQMPSRPRAIVIANNFDSHFKWGRLQPAAFRKDLSTTNVKKKPEEKTKYREQKKCSTDPSTPSEI